MELLLKNLIDFCIVLSSNIDKCSFHVNQIEDQIYFATISLKQNILEIFFLLFFFTIAYIFLHFKESKYKKAYIFFLFNTFLILLTITIFENNIPFTDTWYELDFLLNTTQNNYIFTKFDNFLFGFRPFHLLIFNYFNLNYNIITWLNILIFLFSSIILILLADKNNSKNFIFLVFLIFFSGKWFNIFYEPVNIVWTINLFLTLCFCYLLNLKKNLFVNFCIIIILFFSIINFKASFITIVFSIFYGLFIEKNIKDKLIFILSPIILLLVINYFSEINSIKIMDKNSFNPINYIATTNLILILKNFIAMQSIIFFPYIKHSVILAFLFSIFQSFLIIYYIFNGDKFTANVSKFISNNPLILIGLLGCFTTSLVKQDILQIRYFSYSLLYQIGFLFFIINNFSFLNYIKKYMLLRNFLLLSFFVNLFFFNQGIHFAVSKFTVYAKSLECLNKDLLNQQCSNYIYDKTFYNDKSFEKGKFDNIIIYLKKNKYSIFNNL